MDSDEQEIDYERRGGWQTVETRDVKQEKRAVKKQERDQVRNATNRKNLTEKAMKEAELARLGLGYSLSELAENKPKKSKKTSKRKTLKEPEYTFELDIPEEPKKSKKGKGKGAKEKGEDIPKQPKIRTVGFQQACSSINLGSLQNELRRFSTQYEDELVMLQRLTDLLESLFPKVGDVNKNDKGPLHGRVNSPLRTLKKYNEEAFTAIRDWLADRVIPGEFVTFLVDAMSDDKVEGVGIRLLVSMVARYHTEKIVDEAEYISDKLPVPAYAWIFLQTMYSDPDTALLLWVQHLLPFITTRRVTDDTEVAVDYLACLFAYIGKKSYKIHIPLDAQDLAAELSKLLTLSSRIPDYYYELMDAFFIMPKGAVQFFKEMLNHTSDDDENVCNAAFDVLVFNLKKNTELFAVWKGVYNNYVAETNNLLLYILKNYKRIQNASLPPIVRESYAFVGSDEEDESEESEDEEGESKKKPSKGKGTEIGAMIELNGQVYRTTTTKQQQRSNAARPLPTHELLDFIAHVEAANEHSLVRAKKDKRAALEVCNATCAALRERVRSAAQEQEEAARGKGKKNARGKGKKGQGGSGVWILALIMVVLAIALYLVMGPLAVHLEKLLIF